jgi:hypothetical protein
LRTLPAAILREQVKPVVTERHFLKITVSASKILRYTDAGIDLFFAGSWWLARRFEFDDIERSFEAAPDSTTLRLDNVDGYFTRLVRDTDLRKSETIIYHVWLDQNMDVLGAAAESDLRIDLYGLWDKSEVVDSGVEVGILDESIKAKYCRLRRHSPNCRWIFKGTECAYAGAETWCDFTAARCVTLANYINFGGFQWLLDLKNKEISWGGKQKSWKYR